MARWEEALDYQVDLWQWSRSEKGIQYHRGYANSVINESYDSEGERAAIIPAREIMTDLPRNVENAVYRADPIYVDPDMMLVAEAGFSTFEAEALISTDLITQSGFIILPRPIRIPDIRNKVVATRAILWSPAKFKVIESRINGEWHDRPDGEYKDGIVLYLFSHVDDNDDYWENGGAPGADIIALKDGKKHTVSSADRRRFLGSNKLILNHVEPWMFGNKHDTDDPRSIDPYVQSIWRLMQQTITVKTQSRPSNPFRKRAEKAEYPQKDITVVTLRRPRSAPKDGEHHNVEWSHRWLVNGHWRNQWYPTLETHRQIRVEGYVKGPQNKPLIVNNRVFELVR